MPWMRRDKGPEAVSTHDILRAVHAIEASRNAGAREGAAGDLRAKGGRSHAAYLPSDGLPLPVRLVRHVADRLAAALVRWGRAE